MNRIYIKDLKAHVGEEIIIVGFVQAIRNQGGIKFLIVRDVTGNTQVVVLKSEKDAFEFVNEITLESVVAITGKPKEEKQAPNGVELQAFKIELLSKAAPELPIPVIEKAGEDIDITKRLDWRWLDLRRPEGLQIFKVWTQMENSIRQYLLDKNFIQIHTPSFMMSPSETGADVFEVDYFDRKAYLAQSPQFYKQMAMASGFERVFAFVPAFRAEPSFTARHMTEFTSWDLEVSYIDSHLDLMSLEEDFLIKAFTDLKENMGLDIEVPTKPFPKISIADAKKMLKDAGIASLKEGDVNDEEERKLGELIKAQTGSDFVFLTDYPQQGRAFYHMRKEAGSQLTRGFDLIYKGLEITTGAQREHRYDVLKDQALERGMSEESLEDYLNFFKYGCPPHGGMALGPGRIVMKLLNLQSVKEATFLPRDVKRLRP